MTKLTTGTRHSYALAPNERLVLRFASRADSMEFVYSSKGTVFHHRPARAHPAKGALPRFGQMAGRDRFGNRC